MSAQPLSTTQWQATYSLDLAQSKDSGAIFAMWYLVTEPHTSLKKGHNEFGYSSVYTGVGIYTYAHENSWYVTAIDDLGVTEVNMGLLKARVDRIKRGNSNGCELKPLDGAITYKLTAQQSMLSVEVSQTGKAL